MTPGPRQLQGVQLTDTVPGRGAGTRRHLAPVHHLRHRDHRRRHRVGLRAQPDERRLAGVSDGSCRAVRHPERHRPSRSQAERACARVGRPGSHDSTGGGSGCQSRSRPALLHITVHPRIARFLIAAGAQPSARTRQEVLPGPSAPADLAPGNVPVVPADAAGAASRRVELAARILEARKTARELGPALRRQVPSGDEWTRILAQLARLSSLLAEAAVIAANLGGYFIERDDLQGRGVRPGTRTGSRALAWHWPMATRPEGSSCRDRERAVVHPRNPHAP